MLSKFIVPVITTLLALFFSLSAAPVKIIIDTDMLTDCDDAGCMAMAHAFADNGEAEILAVLLNGKDSHGKHGAVVSAINYYFNRPNIPIGVNKSSDEPSKTSAFSSQIFSEYTHDLQEMAGYFDCSYSTVQRYIGIHKIDRSQVSMIARIRNTFKDRSFTIRDAVKALDVSMPTARKYLEEFCENGKLERENKGRFLFFLVV